MDDREQIKILIKKLEAHKGDRYQLSKADLLKVLFCLKDYKMLRDKLNGQFGKDEE